jgi:hypothetical protein
MQFGSGPKFLLLSSAPASGGFMAEAVGTCQGSPLRFDRLRGAYGGLDRTLRAPAVPQEP